MQQKDRRTKPVPLSGKTINHVNSSPQVLLDETEMDPPNLNIYTDLMEEVECPINFETIVDPVTVPNGQTYERSAIEEWIEENGTDPLTRKKLTTSDLRPNIAFKRVIEKLNSYSVQQTMLTDHKTQQNLACAASFFKPTEKNKFFARSIENFIEALIGHIVESQIDIENSTLESACDFAKITIEAIASSNNNMVDLQSELKIYNLPESMISFIDGYYKQHRELDLARGNLENKSNIIKYLEEKNISAIKKEAGSTSGKKDKGNFSFLGFCK